jgi:hypothetical protein
MNKLHKKHISALDLSYAFDPSLNALHLTMNSLHSNIVQKALNSHVVINNLAWVLTSSYHAFNTQLGFKASNISTFTLLQQQHVLH